MILLGKKTIAVAYIRVSTEKQELGPDAQRKAITEWGLRTKTTIAEVFTDEDVSGKTKVGDRPGLSAAIASLQKHRAGVLIVAKRDRLARDVEVSRVATRMAREAGASIRSADGLSDFTGSAAVLTEGMQDVFAEHERAVIQERTIAALAVKRARGEMTGQPPYGWRLRSGDPAEKLLEPDPFEQWVIRRVHARHAKGETVRGIASALYGMGVRSRHGKKPAPSLVANALRLTPAEGLPVVATNEGFSKLRASYIPYAGRADWTRQHRKVG